MRPRLLEISRVSARHLGRPGWNIFTAAEPNQKKHSGKVRFRFHLWKNLVVHIDPKLAIVFRVFEINKSELVHAQIQNIYAVEREISQRRLQTPALLRTAS